MNRLFKLLLVLLVLAGFDARAQVWRDPAGGGSIGGPITGAADKRVLFSHPAAILAQDPNFQYDTVAQQLLLGNGSAATPFLGGVNFATTGLFWASGPLLGISVGGSQVCTFTSTGANSCAIGVTTPAAITGTTITATTKFLAADGAAATPAIARSAANNTGFYFGSDYFVFTVLGTPQFFMEGLSTRGIVLGSALPVSWSSNADPTLAAPDVLLYRDAANTLAQRNGAAAQTSRVYNSWTSASIGEWFETTWAANAVYLQTNANGTGVARPLNIRAGVGAALGIGGNNSIQWNVNSSGHFVAASNNIYDIGASGATMPRNVYVGTSVNSPTYLTNAPNTQTGTTYTVAATDTYLIFNGAATTTVTLPAAASFTGRRIVMKTVAAFTVVSATSNVVPQAGGAAGTAILAATPGKYAELVSDGTNWITFAAN